MECNLWGYANNNPIKFIDSNGNFIVLGAIAVSALLESATVGAALGSLFNAGEQISRNNGLENFSLGENFAAGFFGAIKSFFGNPGILGASSLSVDLGVQTGVSLVEKKVNLDIRGEDFKAIDALGAAGGAIVSTRVRRLVNVENTTPIDKSDAQLRSEVVTRRDFSKDPSSGIVSFGAGFGVDKGITSFKNDPKNKEFFK
jgi:hypothetical protein